MTREDAFAGTGRSRARSADRLGAGGSGQEPVNGSVERTMAGSSGAMFDPIAQECTLKNWVQFHQDALKSGYCHFDWLSAIDHSPGPGQATRRRRPRRAAPELQPGTGPAARAKANAGGSSAATSSASNTTGNLQIELVSQVYRLGEPGKISFRRHTLQLPPLEPLAVPSLTAIYAGAAWHERETAEMFGVDFSGFQDGSGLPLRPLLLPEGFAGFPLRSSFVLAARVATPWPGVQEPKDVPGASSTRSRAARPRKRLVPPGVPGPDWEPR